MTIIKQVTDARYLSKLSFDTLGSLHGLFVVCEATGNLSIKSVKQLKDARSYLRQRRRMYHLVTSEWSCEHTECNWNGLDVTVTLRIRINPQGAEFTRWLWDKQKQTEIKVEQFRDFLRTTSQDGLASYVRKGLNQVHLDLLKENGAKSWPYTDPTKLTSWLEVVGVEEVECQPHIDTVKARNVGCGTTLLNRYQLIERLGQGGMGQVWKAYDSNLNSNMAIKILAENAVQELANTIREEASVLLRITHSNVATMRGYHEDGNVSFMVMDFIEGCSLEAKLPWRGNDQGGLAKQEIDDWLKPIASAIDYIHQKDIVHRDIKPQNIMIGYKVGDDRSKPPRPFLCDFGIASKNNDVTIGGWGTPGYLAPEVMPENKVTAAADIYSFAVVLFRCLTGKLPSEYDSRDAASEFYDGPYDLASVKRGLEKNPSKRPKSCLDLFKLKDDKKSDRGRTRSRGKGKPIPPVDRADSKSPIVLPVTVMDNYLRILSCCGKQDTFVQIRSLGKDVRQKRVRVGWQISDITKFGELIGSVPAISSDALRKAGVLDRLLEFHKWFKIHCIEEKFDSVTADLLRKIHESIMRNSEEDE